MPSCRKLLAQASVVVDLAVEDDPDRLVFVGDRLVPALQVDDAEPAHADADVPVHVLAVVVGSTMAQLVAEPSHGVGGHAMGRFGVHDPGNATHLSASLSSIPGVDACHRVRAAPVTSDVLENSRRSAGPALGDRTEPGFLSAMALDLA